MTDLPIELLSTTCTALYDARILKLYQEVVAAKAESEFKWNITTFYSDCTLTIHNNNNIDIDNTLSIRRCSKEQILKFKDKIKLKRVDTIEMPSTYCQGGHSLITKDGCIILATYGEHMHMTFILPDKCAYELLDTIISMID